MPPPMTSLTWSTDSLLSVYSCSLCIVPTSRPLYLVWPQFSFLPSFPLFRPSFFPTYPRPSPLTSFLPFSPPFLPSLTPNLFSPSLPTFLPSYLPTILPILRPLLPPSSLLTNLPHPLSSLSCPLISTLLSPTVISHSPDPVLCCGRRQRRTTEYFIHGAIKPKVVLAGPHPRFPVKLASLR